MNTALPWQVGSLSLPIKKTLITSNLRLARDRLHRRHVVGHLQWCRKGSVEETLLSGIDVIGTMNISSKGPNSDSLTFGSPIDGPITVQEDIILNGNGASISILNQGFSPTQGIGFPEPASVISLATGIAIVLVTLTMRGRMKSR